jgi:hypothetical protein
MVSDGSGGAITIKFSVEKTGRATLDVFNLLGQEIATLFDDVVQAGSELASGMYFYRIQTRQTDGEGGEKSELKKFVLVK